MGWGSAGFRIFDPVATALIDAGASEEIKRQVLPGLIEELRANDWDTEHDSLDRFGDDPVIVAIFAEHGISDSADDD